MMLKKPAMERGYSINGMQIIHENDVTQDTEQ